MSRTVDALKKAKALIQNRKRWIQGTPARDAKGYTCNPRSKAAVYFCAIGAVVRVTKSKKPFDFLLAASEVQPIAGFDENYPIWGTNDERGHKATLAMFDRAIAIAKKKEGAK